MSAKDLAFGHDPIFDPALRRSQGRRNCTTVYHMRGYDSDLPGYVRWTNDGAPDFSDTGENGPNKIGVFSSFTFVHNSASFFDNSPFTSVSDDTLIMRDALGGERLFAFYRGDAPYNMTPNASANVEVRIRESDSANTQIKQKFLDALNGNANADIVYNDTNHLDITATDGGVQTVVVTQNTAGTAGDTQVNITEGGTSPGWMNSPGGAGPFSFSGGVDPILDIQVERVELRVPPVPRKSRLIHKWNETDVSQFTLVYGNGVGGHGVAGDWSITFGSFPNDDAPAIVINNLNGNSNSAMWLFNDFFGPLPEFFSVSCRNIAPLGGVGDIGILIYYLSNDRHFLLQRTNGKDQSIARRDPGSVVAPDIGSFANVSGSRDTTYGDLYSATLRLSQADASNKPWLVGRAGGEALTGWRETGLDIHRAQGILQSSADAGWLTETPFTPRIGIRVDGFGGTGAVHVGGLVFIHAYGGL